MIITFSDYAYMGKVAQLNEDYSKQVVNAYENEYEIIEKTPVSIIITCENKEKVNVKLGFSFKALAKCDRCLENVTVSIDIEFEDEFETSLLSIDTDDIISEEIMLNWPMKVLCSEDCKGLCLKCGLNLNKDQCDCDTFVPDPRMAAIKDIFESER